MSKTKTVTTNMIILNGEALEISRYNQQQDKNVYHHNVHSTALSVFFLLKENILLIESLLTFPEFQTLRSIIQAKFHFTLRLWN